MANEETPTIESRLGELIDVLWDIKDKLTEIRDAIKLPERNKEWEKDNEDRRRRESL